MKYIATVPIAMICASPAFAGASRSGSLIGSIVVSATAAVSALNVSALNNVSVLSGSKTSVSAVAPIALKNNSTLNRSRRLLARLPLQLNQPLLCLPLS